MRRRMGAAALDMDAASDGSGQTQWRATVAARLPSQHWPQRTLLITAVDAHTGEPVVFDRHSGVDLVDAVAASTANGFGVPPYGIGDNRYIDGGYRRSSENADLAAGYGRVLVLSPLGGRSRAPLEWGMHLAAQVDELRARGSRVETILPDSNSQRRIRRQSDGSVDASARCSSRLRPRQSPCRAAHRILALTQEVQTQIPRVEHRARRGYPSPRRPRTPPALDARPATPGSLTGRHDLVLRAPQHQRRIVQTRLVPCPIASAIPPSSRFGLGVRPSGMGGRRRGRVQAGQRARSG